MTVMDFYLIKIKSAKAPLQKEKKGVGFNWNQKILVHYLNEL